MRQRLKEKTSQIKAGGLREACEVYHETSNDGQWSSGFVETIFMWGVQHPSAGYRKPG